MSQRSSNSAPKWHTGYKEAHQTPNSAIYFFASTATGVGRDKTAKPVEICAFFAGAGRDQQFTPEVRAARKSTSRKTLQFAPLQPLQLGRISEQPQKKPSTGFEDGLLSSGKSKSLGSAVDRALLQNAVDADLAVDKDRPHSAQFSRKVLMCMPLLSSLLCAAHCF